MKKTEMVLLMMLIAVISIVACQSPSSRNADSAKARQMTVEYDSRTSPISVEALGELRTSNVYSLKKDGVEYIVVEGKSTQGGTTIIRHEPVERKQTALNTSGGWLDEYAMWGYRKAQPSSVSVLTLTNPEIRPVPVGSEDEFIEYHSYVPKDGDKALMGGHIGKVDISLVDIGGVM